ncbi:hypothetical protein N7471_006883 [Penicillium samsonianum]|uniref:uncharacterized protein n=1 Tax=Penicillium samsonianum TaxID=1882272 RepID=UPI0025477287|nr:uncharacterized protein N7471_006883 [Penicillium samsonianum]KAJ6140397.1 hypothetical protein N7471_006883 [Penicillium samsonianum]
MKTKFRVKARQSLRLKKLRECDVELKLLNIEYFQHLAELMKRKPPGNLVHRSGIPNGPTASFVAAAVLVGVVAVNDLGTRFGTRLERLDICTAQEVVDAAPATADTLPQVWYSIKSLASNTNELLVDKPIRGSFPLRRYIRLVNRSENERMDGSSDCSCIILRLDSDHMVILHGCFKVEQIAKEAR